MRDVIFDQSAFLCFADLISFLVHLYEVFIIVYRKKVISKVYVMLISEWAPWK